MLFTYCCDLQHYWDIILSLTIKIMVIISLFWFLHSRVKGPYNQPSSDQQMSVEDTQWDSGSQPPQMGIERLCSALKTLLKKNIDNPNINAGHHIYSAFRESRWRFCQSWIAQIQFYSADIDRSTPIWFNTHSIFLQTVDMCSLRSNLNSSNNMLERLTFSFDGYGVSPGPYNSIYIYIYIYICVCVYHPTFSISQSLFFTLLLHSLFQCCSLDPCPLWPVFICQKAMHLFAMHFQNGVKAALLVPQAFFSSNTLHLPPPDYHIFSPPLTSYAFPPCFVWSLCSYCKHTCIIPINSIYLLVSNFFI